MSGPQTLFIKTTATGVLTPLCGNSGGNGDIDLSLSMNSSNLNPSIYTNVEIDLTVTNDGPQTASGIVINFPSPDNVVYTGGNEWSASQGTFTSFGNEDWMVGNLAAGESATITVSYFLLTANTLTPYAQVIAANETDGDSTPGNGTCCTPNEDDEAAILINDFQGGGGIFLQSKDDRQRLSFNNIYPNPAKFLITLDIFSKENQPAVLDFYNQQGQSIKRMDVELETGMNKFELDISQWRSGTYNVIGRGNGAPAYGRFLKVWEE